MVASFSSSWINATKSSPCPLCGKPDWCSTSLDGEAVVCGRIDVAPDGWVKFSRQSKDGRNIFGKPIKKSIRPKNSRQWIYTSRDERFLVRVRRSDDGEGNRTFNQQRWDGKRWINGLDSLNRAGVAIYKYREIREAIRNGEPIFLVEGESCADALWEIGLRATCNLGGAGKFTASDAADLEGATIIICPDRDQIGIKHADLLAQYFPSANWLYAFPGSYWWNHLPSSGGLDVADWIESGATKDQILAAIEQRRNFPPPPTQSSPPPQLPRAGNNVVAFPGNPKPPLAPIVKNAIAKNPTAEEKREAIRQIESNTGYQLREVEREWREQIRQQQEADELVEARRSLNNLLKQDRLSPFDYLWGDGGKLASAMIGAAEAMPVAPGLVFTTLLPTAAACIGTSSKVVVKSKANYTQPCIFWSVILGRSGQLKTPAQDLVTQPLLDLEIAAAEAYARAEEIYKSDLAEWKKDKNGDLDEPTQPKRKRYLTLDATIESLERVHAENPRGIFVFTDELAGEFRSENAHRGGKGADREKKLSQWNGSAIIVDRKERTVALKRSAVNRTGGCQWDIWTELMGTGDDSNGFFCRWLVCGEESPPRYIDLSSGTEDTGIKDLLKSLYQALERLPDRDYLLSEEAGKFFQTWQHSIVDREKSAKLPAMANLYPKIEAYTSRFALWLHLVNAVLAGEDPAPVIAGETMERAIALAKYYLHQAESILLTYSPQAGLTGILKQIQDYASKKPDGVKPGKLAAGIKAIRKAIENKQLSTEDLYHHCKRLAEQGYGILVDGIYKAVDRQLTAVDHRSTTPKNPEITVYQRSGKSDNNSRLTPVDRRSTAETQEYQGIGAKNTLPVDQLTVSENNSIPDPKTPPSEKESSSSSGQLVNPVNQKPESLVQQAVAPVNRPVNQRSTGQPPRLKVGDRVIVAANPSEGIGIVAWTEGDKYGAEFPYLTEEGEPGTRCSLYDAEELRLAPPDAVPDQPSLGISVPPTPPDGNPKGRRLKR